MPRPPQMSSAVAPGRTGAGAGAASSRPLPPSPGVGRPGAPPSTPAASHHRRRRATSLLAARRPVARTGDTTTLTDVGLAALAQSFSPPFDGVTVHFRRRSWAAGDDGVAPTVTLNYSTDGGATWTEAGEETARALRDAPLIDSLDLSFSDPRLCVGLPRALVSLDMSHAGVSDSEVGAVAALCPGLAVLRLSSGSVTGAGVGALGLCLSRTLVELDLSWNGLGHAAAVCISETLLGLRRVDVHRNAVLDVGALALASLPELRWLDVSHNGLSATVSRNLRHLAGQRFLLVDSG